MCVDGFTHAVAGSGRFNQLVQLFGEYKSAERDVKSH